MTEQFHFLILILATLAISPLLMPTALTCLDYHLGIQLRYEPYSEIIDQGILKGGSITVPLTSCLTGLD